MTSKCDKYKKVLAVSCIIELYIAHVLLCPETDGKLASKSKVMCLF